MPMSCQEVLKGSESLAGQPPSWLSDREPGALLTEAVAEGTVAGARRGQ